MEHLFQSILDGWRIGWDAKELLEMWDEPHRGWHTRVHLQDLVDQIQKLHISDREKDILLIVALFHDAVYEPWRSDNEVRSAQLLLEKSRDSDGIQLMAQMILDTRTHAATENLSILFCKLDMSILTRSYEELLEWEKGISKEYSFMGRQYIEKRLEFLHKMIRHFPENKENLTRLIDFVKQTPRKFITL
jgi:pantetheine-phosphate adenylyltransferase